MLEEHRVNANLLVLAILNRFLLEECHVSLALDGHPRVLFITWQDGPTEADMRTFIDIYLGRELQLVLTRETSAPAPC